MVIDSNQSSQGKNSVIYKNIKSLSCTPENNKSIILQLKQVLLKSTLIFSFMCCTLSYLKAHHQSKVTKIFSCIFCICILVSEPHYVDYYSFTVHFKTKKYESPNFVVFQHIFYLFWILYVSIQIFEKSCQFLKYMHARILQGIFCLQINLE